MRRWRTWLLLLPMLLAVQVPDCFHEFPWRSDEPDVVVERLCVEAADPDRAPDTTFIECALEGAEFADAPAAPRLEIVVLAYNILRGFQLDAQLDAILDDPALPVPDVLLLSEVDRGCERTGFRNVVREYAEALGYHYVYTTEFVELPGQRGFDPPYDPPLCEHGNAIVARWPLGNVRSIRHAANRSWYTPPGFPNPDEPRLGGRVALRADMRVGERTLRLYGVHFESSLDSLAIRDAQAREIAEDALLSLHPVVVGGDLNSFTYLSNLFDGATDAFLSRGFLDAHGGIPAAQRPTSFDPFPLVIDLILTRGARAVEAGICPSAVCGALSDHLPVWARVALPPCPDGDSDCDGVADPDDNCRPLWNPDQADSDGDDLGDRCEAYGSNPLL